MEAEAVPKRALVLVAVVLPDVAPIALHTADEAGGERL